MIAVRNACRISSGEAPPASRPRSSASASSPRSSSMRSGKAARPPAAEPYSRTTSAGSGWGRGGRRTSVRLTVARPWMTGSVLSGPSNAAAIVRQSASVASEWFHPYSARVAP